MLYYDKDNSYVKPKRKKVTINGFREVNCRLSESSLPFSYSPLSYNFTLGSGALRSGVGIEEYSFLTPLDQSQYNIEGCKFVFFYKRFTSKGVNDDRVLIVSQSNRLYQYAVNGSAKWSFVGVLSVDGVLSAENWCYNDSYYCILAGGSYQYVYDGVRLLAVTNSPRITSLCVHSGRVFASQGGEKCNAVWFSDDFNPTNWNVSLTEGGYIEFNDAGGKVVAVKEFLDSVYVFREYAIHRIRGYVVQEEFQVSRLFVCTGRILANTIATTGDGIIFLATDGLYRFDGNDVVRIKQGVTPLIRYTEYTSACYFSTKYYLTTGLTIGKGEASGNNGFLVYDTAADTVNIVAGMDVRCFAGAAMENEEIVFVVLADDTHIGRLVENGGTLYGKSLTKYWRTPMTDFGVRGYRKKLNAVTVTAREDLTLGVVLDGVTRTYYLKGKPKPQKIKINAFFEEGYLEIIAEIGQCEIQYLDLDIELY